MNVFRRRESLEGLRAVAAQLAGKSVGEARALVEAAGGVLHPIDELAETRRMPNRVNVRIADGVVVRVLSIG